jgi:hypothetical protein
MNNYKARWNKAKALAKDLIDRYDQAIKEFGDKTVFTFRGDPISENGIIKIYDNQIILHDTVNTILFMDDPKLDMGSHSTIKEIIELFDELQILVPYKKGK